MTTTSQALFELDSEFHCANIRLCEINGVRHASVLDVIRVMTDAGEQARMVWKRLKVKHAEIEPCCNTTRFPGVVGCASPVADAVTMVRIICCLRGTKASKFRHSNAHSLLATLNPSRQYIEELVDRNEMMNDGQTQQGTSSSFFEENPRIYDKTWMYVRVRLPDGLVRENLSNTKQLTLSVIKFGIAYSLQERNSEYLRDPDNGFMLFSFQCHTRTEAEIVERILRHDFRDIKMFGSREYLDAARLAELLNVDPFIPESYEHYIKVSQQLYAYMVRTIKHIWPSKYHHF